jgi:ketosteroid isomerase-like protein
MKFHLTKIIEDRSPAVVIRALEKCLKQEAWEIKRHDAHVVASGIGTSRNAVNLSDRATFDIESEAGIITVEVDVEYQYAWFLPEDSQDETVHARIESVFANTRAELKLAPEWLIAQNETEEQPTALPEQATPSEALIATFEDATLSKLDSGEVETSGEVEKEQQTSGSEVEELSTEPSMSIMPLEVRRQLSGSVGVPRRHGFGAASVILAAISLVTCIAFWMAYPKDHFSNGHAVNLVPSRQSAPRNFSAPPETQATPEAAPTTGEDNSPSTITSPATATEDLKDWLEEWAASQRTRDARSQASFYAEEVRPYLARPEASREAVLQTKQDAIFHRRGLWTFEIEDVSIRREGENKASVVLKKHFMTQTDTIRVSERRVPTQLTLKRLQDGWQITGERDLQ